MKSLLLLGVALVVLPAADASGGGAVVSGVVRDVQGVAQMGALVQVLAANAVTVGTAFTDTHGRYVIANLGPGRYIVRASQTLFVPATKNNLQLRSGGSAIVNLTLAALFDNVAWLPAERRRSDEAADDWKWTLRSSANRPILRVLDNGSVIEISSSATETPAAAQTRVRETVASGDGSFGGGGVHNILAIHRSLDDGGDMMLRADMGTSGTPVGTSPSQSFEAGYERRVGFDGAARTVVAYEVHPELIAAGSTGGLEVFSARSTQRMNLGEELQVEVGGSLEVVHTSRSVMAAHPFLHIAAHPMGVWTLHYRMATDRSVQGFDDVTTGENDVPVALVSNGRLSLESGRHQEVSVARRAGKAVVSVTCYHDALAQVAVSGGGTVAAGDAKSVAASEGILIDPSTGTFKTLADGYKTNGARITVSAPLMQGVWIAAEYSTGEALGGYGSVDAPGGMTSFLSAVNGLKAQHAEAATLTVKGALMGAGTRVRASYRWQPSNLVTAIDPYSGLSDQAFLSCMLRQPVRLGHRAVRGMDATFDVTNLLAQGYRPFLSADGQTLYFAQSPRTIQAGLSFTF